MPAKPTIGICLLCGGDTRLRSNRVVKYCSSKCASRDRWQTAPQVPLADRFWPRVVKTSSCWLTTGGHHRSGYGMIMAVRPRDGHKSQITMSKAAWFLATGHWPTRWEYVCHDCPDGDNPACVRNDTIGVYTVEGVAYERRGHLWLGTPAANQADMRLKGRGNWWGHNS